MRLFRELRYSARSLSRSPALTTALLATVAIGIGAHATIAGIVHGLLTTNLALPEPRGLVAVQNRDAEGQFGPVPYTAVESLQRAGGPFQAAAAFRESRAHVTIDKRSAWMSIAELSPAFWEVVRATPELGSLTAAPEPGAAAAVPVVISHKLWRNQLGARADAIGTSLVVGKRPGAIVAILPDWFEGLYLGRAVDLWVPLQTPASPREAPVSVLARLRAGVSVEAAQADLAEMTAASALTVTRFTGIEPELQTKFERVQTLLAWAAALVFLTAAANVAGFLLSRAARQSHETAVRVALGATRRDLAARIGADSIVICVFGSILGGLVAFWTATAAPAFFYAEDAERLHARADAWQTAGSVAAYAAIMLVCGLAPLAQIRQHGTMTVLRRSESASATSTGWLRKVLVVGQMSVCVILVLGAALLTATFRQALRTARADSLGQPLAATVEAAGGYSRAAQGAEYFRHVEEDVLRVPGIASLAWTAALPGGRPPDMSVRLELPPAGSKELSILSSTPRGKDLLGFDLIAGRPFGGGDSPSSCLVALANEPVAAQYFHGDALGRSLDAPDGRRIDVIGVVRPKQPDPASDPMLFFFERQLPSAAAEQPRAARYILPLAAESEPIAVDVGINVASANYFDAIGATILDGTAFDPDAKCDIAIVNREAAQLYFGGKAVGGAVIDVEGRRARIVGVVDDGALRVMQRRVPPLVYFPARQRYVPRLTLIAATPAASPELIADVQRRIRGIAGGYGTPVVTTLDERLARTSLGPERMGATVVGASAATALLLGLLGAYGVMADAVRQQKREIALRLALGSQSWRIVATILRDGLRLALSGAAAGLAGAWLVAAMMAHNNPDAARPSLWMWLAGPAALAGIVLVAGILPTRWALAVDPLTIARES